MKRDPISIFSLYPVWSLSEKKCNITYFVGFTGFYQRTSVSQQKKRSSVLLFRKHDTSLMLIFCPVTDNQRKCCCWWRSCDKHKYKKKYYHDNASTKGTIIVSSRMNPRKNNTEDVEFYWGSGIYRNPDDSFHTTVLVVLVSSFFV